MKFQSRLDPITMVDRDLSLGTIRPLLETWAATYWRTIPWSEAFKNVFLLNFHGWYARNLSKQGVALTKDQHTNLTAHLIHHCQTGPTLSHKMKEFFTNYYYCHLSLVVVSMFLSGGDLDPTDELSPLPSFQGLEATVISIPFLTCDVWEPAMSIMKECVMDKCPLALLVQDSELLALLDPYFLCYWNSSTGDFEIPDILWDLDRTFRHPRDHVQFLIFHLQDCADTTSEETSSSSEEGGKL
jgi:hypothetical protein